MTGATPAALLPTMHAVIEHSRAEGRTLDVLCALGWFADGADLETTWPSLALLGQTARMADRSNVRRALRKLAALGEITPIGTTETGAVMYRITPGGNPLPASRESVAEMIGRLNRGRRA